MTFVIEEKDDGKLLRTFLRERGVSAALTTKLKQRKDGMMIGGVRITVRAVLHKGDVLTLGVEETEAPLHVLPRDLPLDVLLRTPDFAVLNKSANMPTHPSHGHFEDTLANALVYHFSTEDAPFRPRFVNRLDRNTTGVVLVAMHPISAAALSQSMAEGKIEKTYLALVHGELHESRVIRTGVRRREQSIIFREVCEIGKGDFAETCMTPLATNGELTLVHLTPRTGRTHQLRVHMAHIGHPLLGDDLYGVADGFPRHALHAATLRFPFGEEDVFVRAPLPKDMYDVIADMGEEVLSLAQNGN